VNYLDVLFVPSNQLMERSFSFYNAGRQGYEEGYADARQGISKPAC
jgi:hypothetical protein